MENRKLTPRRIHTAISCLRGQMFFINSFTSDLLNLKKLSLVLNLVSN